MKRKLFLGIIASAMVIVSTTTQAQRRQAINRQDCILQDDLTQEQKDKLDQLRVSFYQKTQSEHNQLNELMAKKHTLETTDPVDKKALYDCLASINSIQTQLQKQKVRHIQDVKANLTAEQVVMFDSRNKGWMDQQPGQGRGMGQKGPGFENANKEGAQPSERGMGQKGNGHGKGPRGEGKGLGQPQEMGYAQGQGRIMDVMNLTEDQKAFVDKSRLQMIEKEQDLKNKLGEVRAQLKTKTTGANIDLKQIDKLIDEQSDITLKMAQIKADHQLEVRSQLTDEQKMAFDSRPMGKRGNRNRR